jgi:hypothetical protein
MIFTQRGKTTKSRLMNLLAGPVLFVEKEVAFGMKDPLIIEAELLRKQWYSS